MVMQAAFQPTLFPFFSEASLPPLQVTDSFYSVLYAGPLSSNLLCISKLARLCVKPTLSGSPGVFASTQLQMLSPYTHRKAIFACPFFSSCNPPSLSMELILSTPCSWSHLPLSCQGVALAHLDSLPAQNLLMWTNGCVLFLAKNSDVLGNSSLSGAETTLLHSADPGVHTFLLKPVPFRKLSVDLSRTNKSAISPPFTQTLALSLLHFPHPCPSFYLTLSSTYGKNYLYFPPFSLFGYSRFSVTHFF